MIRILVTLAVLAVTPANAATVLFENTCPQPVNQQYLDGIEVIKQAVRDGQRLHVYLQFNQNEFIADVPIAMMLPEVINGLLPQRPLIDPSAKVISGGGIVGGGVDTLGHYRYAPWIFGAAGPGPVITDRGACYIIRWFGD